MAAFWVLWAFALVAYVLQEFVLVRPVPMPPTPSNDRLSPWVRYATFYLPAAGVVLTGLTAILVNGFWAYGILNILGVLITALGIVVRWWARRTLGRWFLPAVVRLRGQPLIARGPYRWARHPGYAGLALFALGLPIIIGNALGLLVLSLPTIAAIVYLTQREDEYLRGAFGPDYQHYQTRTERLIPGLW